MKDVLAGQVDEILADGKVESHEVLGLLHGAVFGTSLRHTVKFSLFQSKLSFCFCPPSSVYHTLTRVFA